MTFHGAVRVVLTFLVATSVACADAAAQRISGWLHTSGGEIRDDQGRVVRFCGVNSSGAEWGAGFPYQKGAGGYSKPQAQEYGDLEQYGFNMVRLPISWANIEPMAPSQDGHGFWGHAYNDQYLSDVESWVNEFGQHHIAVILSMHQWGWSGAFTLPRGDGTVVHGCGMPGWLYAGRNIDATQARSEFFNGQLHEQEWYEQAWQYVARRFANNPYVIGADMFNEPNMHGDYHDHSNDVPVVPLDTFYAGCARAIHAANPHLLLVFQESPSTPVQFAPSFPNAVFSFHSYPNPNTWENGVADLQRAIARGQRWSVPVWMGEFAGYGAWSNGAPTQAWDDGTRQFLSVCKQSRVGWSYWAWQRTSRPIAGVSGMDAPNLDVVRTLQSGF